LIKNNQQQQNSNKSRISREIKNVLSFKFEKKIKEKKIFKKIIKYARVSGMDVFDEKPIMHFNWKS
jgi:hypothetical protein